MTTFRAMASGRARGVVLLSVLLVLALLSAVAWRLMGRHSLVIAQARFTFTGDQALEYALGAEAFARQILYEDLTRGGSAKDSLAEIWAQPTAPFEVEDGFLEVQIRDMHDCFNLNSLAGGAPAGDSGEGAEAGGNVQLERLKTLMRNRNVPDTLAEVWRDWVDSDQTPTGFGAEDGEYLLEQPPYRTANSLAADVSELALVRGIEAEHLAALEGALCVLPTTQLKINVNTASAAVLASLSSGLSEASLGSFAQSGRDFETLADVTSQFPELLDAVDVLAVSSEYFRVNVRAQVNDSQTELSSLLRRDPTSGQIHLVSRDLGRNFQSLFTTDIDEGDE